MKNSNQRLTDKKKKKTSIYGDALISLLLLSKIPSD